MSRKKYKKEEVRVFRKGSLSSSLGGGERGVGPEGRSMDELPFAQAWPEPPWIHDRLLILDSLSLPTLTPKAFMAGETP